MTIAEALYAIPPDDRNVWVRMAMAVKAELGNAGFELWDGWSRQSDKYRAADALAVWRSIRGRGITSASLYHEAKAHGWTGTVAPTMRVHRVAAVREARAHAEQVATLRHQARRRAQQMLEAAELSTHPYLERKGFPEHRGFVLEGALLLPVRNLWTRKLQTLQVVQEDGQKRFLRHGQAAGGVFALGGGPSTTWWCEGYATALSVRAALDHLSRRGERVVACYSAGNMAKMAMWGFIVADNDYSGTGEAYARKAGLPYWMPPEQGDANDYMLKHGLYALAEQLARFLKEVWM